MSSDLYRNNAAKCLDQAAQARRSEDMEAWLLIAEDWLRLAVQSEARPAVRMKSTEPESPALNSSSVVQRRPAAALA